VRHGIFAIGLLAVSGCDLLGIAQTCTSELIMGVGVTMEDSLTGGPVFADSIRVTAEDGTYVETRIVDASEQEPGRISIVEDRPGTYRITVRASGYAPWTAEGVRVRMDDDCHVRSVGIHSRLQRTNQP
jgi:hypothetical protein